VWPRIVAVVSSTERGGEENLGNETATREVDKEGATNGGREERGSTEKRRRSDEDTHCQGKPWRTSSRDLLRIRVTLLRGVVAWMKLESRQKVQDV
jgi:hypothetical protein